MAGRAPERWGAGSGLVLAQKHCQVRGTGFVLSLSQGRNRPGGGCMLCEPDLAKYIRKTFLIQNVLMKEQTASWSKEGSFSV